MRSTALKVLTEGVLATPTSLVRFGVPPITPLAQTLANMPAQVEDRLFARMALLAPFIIATLCLFWLASGVIGLARASEAAKVLEAVGWPHTLAVGSVVFWGLVDIAIAAAFALRRFAPTACWAAIGVSLFYLGASTVTVPMLWVDPLGPLVKVMPGILLALVARAVLDAR